MSEKYLLYSFRRVLFCYIFVSDLMNVNFGYSLLTFIILYNNLIPISLQVSLEVVRFVQVRIYLYWKQNVFCSDMHVLELHDIRIWKLEKILFHCPQQRGYKLFSGNGSQWSARFTSVCIHPTFVTHCQFCVRSRKADLDWNGSLWCRMFHDCKSLFHGITPEAISS
jgi:hypothetical protein